MPVNAEARGTLVIHRGALGDLLGAVPALRALRHAFPAAPITLVANPAPGRLLQRCGLVDAVRDVHTAELLALFADTPVPPALYAWCAEFGRALAWIHDPQGRTRCVLRRAGVEHVVVSPPFGRRGGQPHAAHLAGAVAGLTVAPEIPGPPLALHDDDLAAAARWLRERLPEDATPILAVHPGSGSAAKNWPPEGFRRAIASVRRSGPARVLVVLGPVEAETGPGAHVWAGVADAVARELPLPVLAGVMGQCDAWLGNDTGPTHLAAALGVPTLALFGAASDPAVWAPLGAHVRLLAVGCANGGTVDRGEVAVVAGAVREGLGLPRQRARGAAAGILAASRPATPP